MAVTRAQTLRESLWAAGLFAVAVVCLYHETVLSMVTIWVRSETFAHGLLILPISLWLVWSRRDYLVAVQPSSAPWVALLALPAGAAWLLATLLDVQVVQHLALVATLIAGVWAIIGHRLAAVLAFPLFFLFFMVPMGEGLIAPMMEFTATSTVWLIRETGIPVYREGLFFTLPTGRWSVVEACSGVRYIIASVTVGTLFAYLTYTSWWRRALFIIVSAVVPVFANTVRAYLIVILGHTSDMKIATGVDHLVYGWVFFGLVIFILFWLGSFFREDLPPAEPAVIGERTAASGASRTRLAVALFCALGAVSLAPLLVHQLARPDGTLQPAPALPSASGNWRAVQSVPWGWQPVSMVGGLQQAFYALDDRQVGLIVQYADGSFALGEVIGSSGLFVWQENAWKVIGRDRAPLVVAGQKLTADEGHVRGPGGEFIAWSWYLLGDIQTANDYLGKFQQAAVSMGMGAAGAWRIILVTPLVRDPAMSREVLALFLEEHGTALVDELRSTSTGAR